MVAPLRVRCATDLDAVPVWEVCPASIASKDSLQVQTQKRPDCASGAPCRASRLGAGGGFFYYPLLVEQVEWTNS
jgi:hypothetical protein